MSEREPEETEREPQAEDELPAENFVTDDEQEFADRNADAEVDNDIPDDDDPDEETQPPDSDDDEVPDLPPVEDDASRMG